MVLLQYGRDICCDPKLEVTKCGCMEGETMRVFGMRELNDGSSMNEGPKSYSMIWFTKMEIINAQWQQSIPEKR